MNVFSFCCWLNTTWKALLSVAFIKLSVTSWARILTWSFPVLGARLPLQLIRNIFHQVYRCSQYETHSFHCFSHLCKWRLPLGWYFTIFWILSHHMEDLSILKLILENRSIVMWNGLDWHRMWFKGSFRNNSDEALDSITSEFLINQCLTAQDRCCTTRLIPT
jgi:hypothetical protein